MAFIFWLFGMSWKKFNIEDFYNLFLLILEHNEGVALQQTLLKGLLGELIIQNVLSWLSRQYWPISSGYLG